MGYSFPERAVLACCNSMSSGKISTRLVNNVIKYAGVDVSSLEMFLTSDDYFIRKAAVEIIGKSGNKEKLVEVIESETERQILLIAVKAIGKDGDKLEEIVSVLENTDPLIRYQVIDIYKKSGKSDCLISLLFDDDDSLVERIKGYMKNG